MDSAFWTVRRLFVGAAIASVHVLGIRRVRPLRSGWIMMSHRILLDRHNRCRPISLPGTQIHQTIAAISQDRRSFVGAAGAPMACVRNSSVGYSWHRTKTQSSVLDNFDLGARIVCLIALIVVWGTWVMVPPEEVAQVEAAPWTNRLGLILSIAWPIQCGAGNDRLKLSEPMRAVQEDVSAQVEIQDILALVVGYGMAALLFRAFWPLHPAWSSLGLPGAGLYLWLGLAMSGPIIMLRRRLFRRQRPPAVRAQEPVGGQSSRRLLPPGSAAEQRTLPARAPRSTWAEQAWLLIGAYWIVLGIFVIPARLHEFKLGDVLLFGLAPIVVAVGLRLLGPSIPEGANVVRRWTHTAAVALLVTWPFAWICLIVLGRSVP